MDDSRSAEDSALTEFGRRLVHRRLERNLTQAQLSREAGVSKRTVERIESGGSTQLSTLIRILRALGLLDRFAALIPDPPPSPLKQLDSEESGRQRASGTRTKAEGSPGIWQWGDEK